MADDETPMEDAAEGAEAPAEEEPPVVLPEHEGVLERIRAGLGDGVADAVSNHGDLVVRVTRESWHRAAEVARERLDCEYVSFISAIDWMPRPAAPTEDPDAPSIPTQPQEMKTGVAGGDTRFQVFACVQSTDDRVQGSDGPGPTVQVIFKADVDEADAQVASWTDVYPGADWHERECWEMYGIAFDGHPHLRHLYLPGEFEGHPLRKDFPLLSREVKPWPGLVDVELMPGGGGEESENAEAAAGGESS